MTHAAPHNSKVSIYYVLYPFEDKKTKHISHPNNNLPPPPSLVSDIGAFESRISWEEPTKAIKNQTKSSSPTQNANIVYACKTNTLLQHETHNLYIDVPPEVLLLLKKSRVHSNSVSARYPCKRYILPSRLLIITIDFLAAHRSV